MMPGATMNLETLYGALKQRKREGNVIWEKRKGIGLAGAVRWLFQKMSTASKVESFLVWIVLRQQISGRK